MNHHPTPLQAALFAALCAASLAARGGFVSDFIDEAKEGANVTPAGILESESLTTMTGGGFVYHAKRRDFTPFSISPPSLKAGCGGIDLFLGAFSIPSREEFVSFLRSVGTALPGLAFQLALQTMAPDLNEMVGRYADLIRSYTNRYSDSCQAAQSLLEDTGAATHIARVVQAAKNSLRSEGEAADQSEADRLVRDNGAKAVASAPERRDSQGNILDAPQINLTWALLGSGNFARGSTALKETMMTMLGTTIFRESGSGADKVLAAREIAGVDLLPVLFDEEQSAGAVVRLACDETRKCLAPKTEAMGEASLVAQMQAAAAHYLGAIESRNAALVTDDELVLLSALSSVPLLRVLNLASLSRYRGIAADLVSAYVRAAAYEAITTALEGLNRDVRQALQASPGSSVTLEHQKHAEKLLARIGEIDAQLARRRDSVMQSMIRAGAMIEQIEHVERSLKGNAALALERLMPSASGLAGK